MVMSYSCAILALYIEGDKKSVKISISGNKFELIFIPYHHVGHFPVEMEIYEVQLGDRILSSQFIDPDKEILFA